MIFLYFNINLQQIINFFYTFKIFMNTAHINVLSFESNKIENQEENERMRWVYFQMVNNYNQPNISVNLNERH